MDLLLTRASLLAKGPLSGGFIIDQRLKILAWDDLGSYHIGLFVLNNIGRILVKFWIWAK